MIAGLFKLLREKIIAHQGPVAGLPVAGGHVGVVDGGVIVGIYAPYGATPFLNSAFLMVSQCTLLAMNPTSVNSSAVSNLTNLRPWAAQ